MTEFIFNDARDFVVDRDGQHVTVTIPDGTIKKLTETRKVKGGFIGIRTPFIVGNVSKASAAEKMGLKSKDSIIALNDQAVHFFDEFEQLKQEHKGQRVHLTVIRDNHPLILHGNLPEDGIFGFNADMDPKRYFEVKTIKYGFFASISKGFSTAFEKFASYGQQLKFMFTSKEVKISKSVGGIVSFGQMFPTSFSWEAFLELTAFVSIILAFMNLLPIPGLDGGYVLFLLFELVSGKKVSDKVMERATTVGLVLLLGLMLYANGLDIFRLFK